MKREERKKEMKRDGDKLFRWRESKTPLKLIANLENTLVYFVFALCFNFLFLFRI